MRAVAWLLAFWLLVGGLLLVVEVAALALYVLDFGGA